MKVFYFWISLLILTCQMTEALGDIPQKNEVDRLIGKAIYYLDHQSNDSAVLCLDSAALNTSLSNNQINQAYIKRLKGYAYLKNNQYDSADYYLEKAINQAKHLNNDTILAIAYLNIGWINHQKGWSDSALIRYKEGLMIYQNIGDTSGMAKAHTYLASYYNRSGDFDKALKNALEAAHFYSKKNNPKRYIKSLIQLGNSYENLQDYDTAIACYKKAYQLSLAHKFQREANSSIINIAVIHYNLGIDLEKNKETARAKEEFNITKNYFLKAIHFNDSINNHYELGLVYSNISAIYRRLNEDQKAIKAAKTAIEIANEQNIPSLRLQALNNLGICYKKRKDYIQASNCYLESLALAKELHYLDEIVNTTSNLSNIYEISGDYKESLQYARLAAAYQDSLFNENKQKLIEQHKTNYEILQLKDQQKIIQLKKDKLQQERNIIFGVASVVVIILVLLFIFFRMRARKNRIIAAQKIQKLEDEKKLMAAQSVMVGQEKERERIARELHDGIGVLLSTASIHFSSVEEKSDPKTSEMLKKANKLLKDASKEVREISHNMMPGVLSKFGLREAIEDLFEDVEDAGEIKVDLQITCKDQRLAENMEIMIYRVIQEMLNNTIKHAKATLISLTISRTEHALFINYKDNGVGFDENQLPHGKNIGLSGIRSRIEYLGGKVALISQPGEGTSYSVSIPIVIKLD